MAESPVTGHLSSHWPQPLHLSVFTTGRPNRCRSSCSKPGRRQLAEGLLRFGRDACGVDALDLATMCADPRCRELRVAEINSAGRLHPALARLPGLA